MQPKLLLLAVLPPLALTMPQAENVPSSVSAMLEPPEPSGEPPQIKTHVSHTGLPNPTGAPPHNGTHKHHGEPKPPGGANHHNQTRGGTLGPIVDSKLGP